MSPYPQKTHKLKGHEKMGEFTLIQRIPYNVKESPLRRLKWRVQCSCGKRLTIPEYYMMRKEGPKTHCGCKRESLQSLNPEEFRIWTMMNYRCQKPNHVAYKHYGGRGIHVCPEWHKDNPDGFKNFLAFMGKRPSPKHTIDRVDNDYSYYPFQKDGVTRQLVWATMEQQRANQRTPEQVRRDNERQRQKSFDSK